MPELVNNPVLINSYEPEPDSLSGKTLLITGAAGGLGSAIAREAATLGAELVLLDNNQSKLCLLYTSPSPRDRQKSRMPSSA